MRDLSARESPDVWLQRVRRAGLVEPDAPLSLANLQTDPIVEVPAGTI